MCKEHFVIDTHHLPLVAMYSASSVVDGKSSMITPADLLQGEWK